MASLRVARSLWESKPPDRKTKIPWGKEFDMTRQRFLMAIVMGMVLAGVFVFGGERFYQSRPAQKSGHSTDLNKLRAKFNADKGKVRLLMLLSPT